MKVQFTPQAWEDYKYWQATDRKLVKRVNALIDDICRDPDGPGIGKPEQLRYGLAGAMSRRITDEHRLVYRVRDDVVEIAQARYHYK